MKKKSVLLLVVALLMAFSLSACGEKKDAADDNAGKDIVATALTNMNDAKSMTYEMTMDMGMTAAGEAVNMTSTGNIDYIKDPMTMKMEMNMDFGDESAATTMTSYMETVDGEMVMYTNTADAWYKQSAGSADMMEQYDATKTINAYVSDTAQFKETSTEEINGTEATKYEGVISEENLTKAMAESGALSQLGAEGMDEATLKNLFEGMGDLPMSIWIDKKTVLPVKYEMDMSSMVKKLMEKMLAEQDSEVTANTSVEKMKISIVITGYDNVSAIEIPEEARNGQDISEME